MNERTKKILRWVAVAVVALLAIIGIVVLATNQKRMDYNPSEVQRANADNGEIDEHYLGNLDSGVIFVEYGDYQCPGCSTADARILNLVKEYGDKIGFIFRNFPMASMHPNAKAAAAAAEAAGRQGKYWEMHSLIFTNQSVWSNSSATRRTEQFQNFARQLELNMEQFDADFASSRVIDKINFDMALGKKDNVNATPFFILNGRALNSNEWSNDAKLRQVLDEEISKAEANNSSASGDANQDNQQ